MNKANLFIVFCLLFTLGVFLANFFKIALAPFYIFIIYLLILILSIFYWPARAGLFLLGLSFVLLGVWRYQASWPDINPQHIAYYSGQSVQFLGQVVQEPDIRDKYRKLVLGKLLQLPAYQPLTGQVLVNLPNYPAYSYGDWLQISCQLKAPDKFNGFDYKRYLAIKGIYVLCHHPLLISSFKNSNLTFKQKLYKQLLKIKYSFKRIIDSTVAYPQNEILSAIVLGLRRGIPPNILNTFQASGLSHIIAISGLHISIISLLLMNFFIALGFYRRQAFYLAAISLFLFICMIGLRASSLRAAIMGLAILLAMQLGRLSRSLNILILAACFLLLINPKLLADIGFQLSFLAVLGIIYLGEPFNNLLDKLRVPEIFEIKASLMMTLSAQLAVLPLIVYYFGNLSLVAPLANILVLPVLPIIIVLGFMLGLAGFIFWPLAELIGWLINLLVQWMIYISQALTHLPYANFLIVRFDLIWVLVIYLVLAYLIWSQSNKKLKINL